MFDFGSDLRDEGGVKGRNNKGLVTFDRSTKKDAFYFYKSIWSEEKVLHITSKRFKDRHTATIGVKVYSNLDHVQLFHNGNQIALESRSGTVFVFTVPLSEGDNTVTARGEGLEDSVVFRKVNEPNPDYVLPEEERKKGILHMDLGEHVSNWFDVKAPGDLEFPEGYYSIKDSIKSILSTEQGREVMEEHFPALLKDRRLKMAMKMPFEMIINFKPDAFPEALVYEVNRKLNKIPK
jgi:beta-galactosidase